jgi:hypothetical protein
MRAQPVRRGTEMPGEPIAHASLECRPHDRISRLLRPLHSSIRELPKTSLTLR